ncbi:MAG: epoxyqueuosine reductase QueH [Erysipelotrichaceae bacterium]|nr:epoxyqueuosine reductase QueH [Erysipelotrichaceae bacterium]
MNNYQKHIKQIKELKGKPSLLLHICCGVCSVYPLEYLRKYFKITIFFSNSNIYPYEEYNRRLDALKTYLKILNDKDIVLIEDTYDNESYAQKLSPLKDEKEGGRRCYMCYGLRMERAYEYADRNHYDYFTTVMSISNRKNAEWLNEIGENLSKKYKYTKYLYADFKKNDGITNNEKMNKELNLYHQDYCGCIYSIRDNQK